MGLTDEDIDRIGDKFKVALADHVKDDHVPIHKSIGNIKVNMAYAAGGLAVLVAIIEFVAK